GRARPGSSTMPAERQPPDAPVTLSPCHPVTLSAPRGRPLIAWVVIVAAVSLVLWRNAEREESLSPARLVTLRVQARYTVGVSSFGLPGADPELLYDQLRRSLENVGPEQRLGLVVLAGELVGPEEALKQLEALDRDEQ